MPAKSSIHRPSSSHAARADEPGDEVVALRKAVNTLAIVPKSARITTLGRKTYNVLLHQAQGQGLDNDVFRAPLDALVKGLDYDSNDIALIKRHLRAMVSTTVEWQSPTTGEGTAWNVSGLLAHATLSKEGGQVWVEWSYAVNLKQELLEPTVFARLRLEIISQLRSHAALALYEICTRYKDIGQTARQAWRWWYPVLSGNPASEKSERLEYRIFKRDTLKPAIAEINALTDLDVELVEHKHGRAIAQIQFRTSAKRQATLTLNQPPSPVDMAIVAQAQRLGVSEEAVEALVQEHGEPALRQGLTVLEKRMASAFPEPLRDPARYLRAVMPTQVAAAPVLESDSAHAAEPPGATHAVANRELQARRHAHWLAEWTRRQHERCAQAIEAMSAEQQKELEAGLLEVLQERGAHPSITKRLSTSGWQHPLVRHEMLRYFGAATFGEQWDRPTAEQLLDVAAEMGEGGA